MINSLFCSNFAALGVAGIRMRSLPLSAGRARGLSSGGGASEGSTGTACADNTGGCGLMQMIQVGVASWVGCAME